VVRQTTHFHADTCKGFDLDSCATLHQALVLHVLGPGKWVVTLPPDFSAGDVDNTCEALQSPCNHEITLDGDKWFAVYQNQQCGEVTFDVTAEP
jgi:hypothetical protein